jgi:hypothetical protein
MATARNIITLTLEGMNRLAPGEVIDADVAAVCLRRLNSITDNWSAGRDMMPQDAITSGVVSGATITLASGPFAAITAGDEILSMTADGYVMDPITMEQYNNIRIKTISGRPLVWAFDGLATVYLFPVPTSSVMALQDRVNFKKFADMDTVYVMPAGYEGAFAASLAVAIAPAMIGKVTPDLLVAERKALFNIAGGAIKPAIVIADPLRHKGYGAGILQGF